MRTNLLQLWLLAREAYGVNSGVARSGKQISLTKRRVADVRSAALKLAGQRHRPTR